MFYPAPADPSDNRVVDIINPSAQGDFVLVCEHAGNAIPADLKNLGLPEHVLQQDGAWNRGALEVATDMSVILDAPLIAPRVSRLVYDCNRRPADPLAMPGVSDFGPVPGNRELSDDDRRARVKRVYEPFCKTVSHCLKPRMVRFRRPILITINAFAPIVRGIWRQTTMGILHDSDRRLAEAVVGIEEIEPGPALSLNQPAGPRDCTTNTLHEHAIPRDILNAMFLIRGDLVASRVAQQKVATRLSRLLREALARLEQPAPEAEPEE